MFKFGMHQPGTSTARGAIQSCWVHGGCPGCRGLSRGSASIAPQLRTATLVSPTALLPGPRTASQGLRPWWGWRQNAQNKPTSKMKTRCKLEHSHRDTQGLSPIAIPRGGAGPGGSPTLRERMGGWRGAPSRPLALHPGCLLSALLSRNLFLTLICWKHKRPRLFSPRYEHRGKAEEGRLRSLLKPCFGGT